MKILITGYKGFIGQNMVFALSGHDLTLIERDDAVPDITGYDYVIHLGAISATTERDVEKVLHYNLDYSIDLLNLCIEKNVNLQYASSASVYGNSLTFNENDKPDPKSPYAWSKYLFDRYVLKNLKNIPIKVQGFRYFNVYGKYEDHKGDQSSPYHKFRKQYETTGKIKLFENSEKYLRDFVPVEEVCKTHIEFFDVNESGIFNIGTGTPKSFLDVALSIAPKEHIEYIPMPDILRQSYQTYTCADMNKTNKILRRK